MRVCLLACDWLLLLRPADRTEGGARWKALRHASGSRLCHGHSIETARCCLSALLKTGSKGSFTYTERGMSY